MNTTLENAIVRVIDTPWKLNKTEEEFQNTVRKTFNPSRYYVLGFMYKSSRVVLAPRFHNVRDPRGRWTRIKTAR